MGTLHRALGRVNDDHLVLDVAPGQRLLAWQAEGAGAQQGILDDVDGAADGGLAEAIRLGDVGVGAVLAPVHERQQQSVLQAQFGDTPARRQVLLQRFAHVQEGRGAHPSQALERAFGLIFEVSEEHTDSIQPLCKRSSGKEVLKQSQIDICRASYLII